MSLFDISYQEMQKRLDEVAKQAKPHLINIQQSRKSPSELSALLNEIMRIQVSVRSYYIETFATAWLLETGYKATECKMIIRRGRLGEEIISFSYSPPVDDNDIEYMI